jgi:hypothetical protein
MTHLAPTYATRQALSPSLTYWYYALIANPPPFRLGVSNFLQPPAISWYLPTVQPMATVDGGGAGKRNPVAGLF